MVAAVSMCLPLLCLAPSGDVVSFVAPDAAGVRRVVVLNLDDEAAEVLDPGPVAGVPRWSPDGQYLAFEVDAGGGRAVAVVAVPGGAIPVAHGRAWARWPRWSPDSRFLAYAVGSGPASAEPDDVLTVLDVATGEETVWGGGQPGLLRPIWVSGPGVAALMAQASGVGPVAAGQPALEQLGDLSTHALLAVGYVRNGGRLTTELFVVGPGGAVPLPPGLMPSRGTYAEWAVEINPAQDRLAFESNDGGDREVFVLSERLGAVDVSNHRAADWNPVWSPNPRDRQFLFESLRSGRSGIYRCYADTANVLPAAVTDGADNWAPAWAPDGARMAFVSNRAGYPAVFVASVGRGRARQVSDGEGYGPAWRPVAGSR